MTKKQICEQFGIEDPVYFFEPEEVFNKGILGVSEDHKHIIYGYYTLATALAEDYEKEWNNEEHDDCDSLECEPDFLSDAFGWIDTNTSPTADIIAMSEKNYPIIIYELNHEV